MTDDQFLTLSTLLLEIRDGLYALVGAAMEDEPEGCQHPEPNRVSLATPSRPDHWICNVCRYEHGGLNQQ